MQYAWRKKILSLRRQNECILIALRQMSNFQLPQWQEHVTCILGNDYVVGYVLDQYTYFELL